MTLHDFVSFLDDLYFDGYASQLAKADPEKYAWELAEWKATYA